MKKHKFPLLLVMGICLIVLGVSLLIGLQLRLRSGAQYSERIMMQIAQILPERRPGVPGLYPVSDMPTLEVEGTDYVAVLEIPSFDITLPVAGQYYGNRLHRSPAKFFGSVYDGKFIIAGVDGSAQLGFCDKIEHGAVVTITDMTGSRFVYEVAKIERAKRAETQWLMDADCALTLFCYDMYSMEYIAVRCDLAYH